FKDRPIIAKDVVRYVGEPVVAVLATSEAIAEDAIELINVEYDFLPAVTEMQQSWRHSPACRLKYVLDVAQA
ncbi:hypothetical protein JVW21_21200, partial [Vibrio cholerae O1]|nr:hypothetical protein [Vibrio cholerae O1]